MVIVFVCDSFAFLPYLETVYAEVLELVDYPAVGIKKAAIATLGQLCLCVHETCSNTPSGDAENGEFCLPLFGGVSEEDLAYEQKYHSL